MKTAGEWRQHLRDLVNASLDPMVCAVRWARDPRFVQRGAAHRRVSHFVSPRSSPCRLWSFEPK